MSQVTTSLFEDSSSNDIEGGLIAPSVPPLPLSRKRPRDGDVGSEDVQVAGHRESHEGIAAAASQPINSDLEQISRNDGSEKKRSKKRSTSEPPSNASGRQRRVSSWRNRVSELEDFRKIYGHCNVSVNYSENLKLAKWVEKQRTFHRLHRDGEKSSLTLSRIQELHSMGFDFRANAETVWEDRLRELADFHESHGHCNVPDSYCGKSNLAYWVAIQRTNYSLHLKGKGSSLTISRIQKLESLGFEWERTAGESCAQSLKGVHTTERNVGSEVTQVAGYHESHKGSAIAAAVAAAAASHPMKSDSQRTSQNQESANKYTKKLSTSKPPLPTWEDRLNKLAEYRKIHGDCNVPFPKKGAKHTELSWWVRSQRFNYRLHQEGKASPMTTFEIQGLESLGFQWNMLATAWGERLSQLTDYCKIHGHCNVPIGYSKNKKLASWVKHQRIQYKLQQEGKTSTMTLSRIQELVSLGFEWDCHSAAWELRLSELADYRRIHGHCNVPDKCSENLKLAKWVGKQRSDYRQHQEGKTSSMTLSRIQELESLGFEWKRTAWDIRFRELANYRKTHGHCNVSWNDSKNAKLYAWIGTQRKEYTLHLKGKKISMTPIRIEALESLDFEWDCSWEDHFSELTDYHEIHGHCNVPQSYGESSKLSDWVTTQRSDYVLAIEGSGTPMAASRIRKLENVGFEWRKKMSERVVMCRDSGDDSGEGPNSASIPTLPRSTKRLRDKTESGNGPVKKTARGSAKFVYDLEFVDEVEAVAPQKKQRGVVRRKPNGKNDVGESCAQSLKGVHTTERNVGSEVAQVADYHESLGGIRNGPVKKTTRGSAKFVYDLEFPDEVEEVSPQKKRRGVVRSKPSGKNDA
jgi:uncharacterized protein YerC